MTDPKPQARRSELVDATASDMETAAPDLRVTDEAFVWNSDCFARIKIRPPGVDSRFLDRLIAELDQGLLGRGMAAIDGDGLIRIVFGVNREERASTDLLDWYVVGATALLGVSHDAVVHAQLERVELEPEVAERQQRRLLALGLRALNR